MAEDDVQDGAPAFVEVSFPNFYTNSVTLTSTSFDLAMLMTERLDSQNVTVKARIVMAHKQAKLLLLALRNQIDQIEARFGEIKIPELTATSDLSSIEPEQQL